MTDVKQPIELLVAGAGEVATPLGTRPLGGAGLGQVDRRPGAAVAVDAGRVVAVGDAEALGNRFAPARTLDAGGGLVLPGFVDAHTHPVFADTREREFELRVAGASYLEITAAGGGIGSSVRGVREASEEQLTLLLARRLDRMLAHGTTTVEAKSGYGLETEAELKSLRAIRAAAALHPVDVVATFLGAHDYPAEYKQRQAEYVDLVVDEMLPRVADERLAEYADVFTESHTFGLDATRRIGERARDLGMGLRLHVDQLTPLGGAVLAAELGVASADHLEQVTRAGIDALAENAVQPTLCPLVPLFIRDAHEAPGRALVEAGCAPALATDFNPGSCYVLSMPEVCSWAALRYGFTAAECLTAATLNAACTLGRGHDRGSLEPGKRADLVVLDVPNLEHLTYDLGRNPVAAVVVEGEPVWERPPLPRFGGGQ
ncbi:MAG: imidazolonepropionase [Planctomycetota bacterium]